MSEENCPELDQCPHTAKVMGHVEALRDDIKGLSEKIDNLTNRMLDPDEGIYQRIKDTSTRVSILERQGVAVKKFVWLVVGAFFTALGGLFVKIFKG